MYNKAEITRENPFLSESKDASMRSLFAHGQKHGVTYYRSGFAEVDTNTGTFSDAWALDNDGKWEIVQNIKADAIADHTSSSQKYYEEYITMSQLDGVVPVCNQSHIRRTLGSKLMQYAMFNEDMIETGFINNKKQLQHLTKRFGDSLCVAKPIYGQKGDGVIKGSIDDFLDNDTLNFPIIVQKHVQSTFDIPGTDVGGFADLRLTFVDHKLIYSLSRIAPKGDFITSVSKGGKAVHVPIAKVPEEAMAIAKKVVKKLSFFPHATYCVDFLFDHGTPKIVELNTRPCSHVLYKTGNMDSVAAWNTAVTNQYIALNA